MREDVIYISIGYRLGAFGEDYKHFRKNKVLNETLLRTSEFCGSITGDSWKFGLKRYCARPKVDQS